MVLLIYSSLEGTVKLKFLHSAPLEVCFCIGVVFLAEVKIFIL